jgi:hypothetical protein
MKVRAASPVLLASIVRIVAVTFVCVVAALGFVTTSVYAQELPILAPLNAANPITFHVAEAESGSGYRSGDEELCQFALEDWGRASGGRLSFVPSDTAQALVRIHFVAAQSGQYGEMRPIMVGGRRGAEVFIRPDTDALGPSIGRAARADELLRDTIVYLTCLHELGHALGLEHTADIADVMYFFGFGGDIDRFFRRYREQVSSRAQFADVTGISAGDRERLQRLYPSP